jgi:hypothetical protein
LGVVDDLAGGVGGDEQAGEEGLGVDRVGGVGGDQLGVEADEGEVGEEGVLGGGGLEGVGHAVVGEDGVGQGQAVYLQGEDLLEEGGVGVGVGAAEGDLDVEGGVVGVLNLVGEGVGEAGRAAHGVDHEVANSEGEGLVVVVGYDLEEDGE